MKKDTIKTLIRVYCKNKKIWYIDPLEKNKEFYNKEYDVLEWWYQSKGILNKLIIYINNDVLYIDLIVNNKIINKIIKSSEIDQIYSIWNIFLTID